MAKMKNDFIAIMNLIMLLWPIIQKWLEGEQNVEDTQENIAVKLIAVYGLTGSDADRLAAEVLSGLAPNPKGILDELGKAKGILSVIAAILDQIIAILSKQEMTPSE